MTIVQSIDAERTGVREEIEQLEAQLGPLRTRLEGLDTLREQAEGLSKPEGGGISAPAAAPKAAPKKHTGSRSAAGTPDERDAKVLAVIEQHPDGIAPREIVDQVDLSRFQVSDSLKRLLPQLRREGYRRSARYFPKGAAERPKGAPEHERRAAPAPDDEPTEPRLPARKESGALKHRTSRKADAEVEQRERVAAAVVETIREHEPVKREDLIALVLEQMADADKRQVENALTLLARRKKIDRWADGYHAVGLMREGPITQAEKDAAAAVGSGRTCKEVAANCDTISDATSARSILEGLVRRNVIRRREGSSPPVFEALETGVTV